MSRSTASIVWPTSGRLTLIALAVVPAALAFPWHTPLQRLLLGVAVALTVVVLSWWNGRHLTTAAVRRVAVWSGRGGRDGFAAGADTVDSLTTAVLRIQSGPAQELPLDVITGYLDRYGVRGEAVRVTTRSAPGERTTWVGITVSGAANLTALQARSAELPLYETAEAAVRRLSEQLRELGWAVVTGESDIPDVVGAEPQERWRSVIDGNGGYLAAYSAVIDDALAQTVAAIHDQPALEAWTALEITRTRRGREIALGSVIRTKQEHDVVVTALRPQHGYELRAVRALNPLSSKPLVAQHVPLARLPKVTWTHESVVEATA